MKHILIFSPKFVFIEEHFLNARGALVVPGVVFGNHWLMYCGPNNGSKVYYLIIKTLRLPDKYKADTSKFWVFQQKRNGLS